MKIIICGPAYPYRGGIAAYNERLARQLINEGDDVQIFTFSFQYPSILFPGKTQYNDGAAPEGIRIKRVINSINPFNWFIAGRKIRKENPDILILRYWLPFMAPALGTIARIVRKKRHTKVITIFDNVVPHEKRPGDIMLTKFFVKSIDGALLMTKSVLDDLRRFDKSMPSVISPHPLFDNYGDTVTREVAARKLGLDSDVKYILFFGFVREYKGLDLLIEAMATRAVKDLNIKLIVAGEFYNDPKPYLDLIHLNELTEKVILHTRFISDEDVKYYFSIASLIVQPYRSATQSGVTQIGYHFRKPMLVTDVGGLSEIVPHGKCGYVVSPEVSSIAGAIEDFFTNKREDSFAEGIEKQREIYSWPGLTENLKKLAERID